MSVPLGTVEQVGANSQIVTVMHRECLFNGELEHLARHAIKAGSDAVIIDLTQLVALDDIAAARLERASRQLVGAGVELAIVCPAGGLPEDRFAHGRRAR